MPRIRRARDASKDVDAWQELMLAWHAAEQDFASAAVRGADAADLARSRSRIIQLRGQIDELLAAVARSRQPPADEIIVGTVVSDTEDPCPDPQERTNLSKLGYVPKA